jgi:hypothetical protein
VLFGVPVLVEDGETPHTANVEHDLARKVQHLELQLSEAQPKTTTSPGLMPFVSYVTQTTCIAGASHMTRNASTPVQSTAESLPLIPRLIRSFVTGARSAQ